MATKHFKEIYTDNNRLDRLVGCDNLVSQPRATKFGRILERQILPEIGNTETIVRVFCNTRKEVPLK